MAIIYNKPPMMEGPSGETEVVGGIGDAPSEYMVILQAPPINFERHRALEPTTPTKMSMFRTLRQKWGSVYLSPLVKWRRSMKDKKVKVAEIRQWLPVIYGEINMIRPKRILIMGDPACKELIPTFKNLREDHGGLFTMGPENTDGLLEFETVMVPTFWFNDLERDPTRKPMFMNDLRRFYETEVTIPTWQVVDDISSIPIPKNATVSIDVETNGLDLTSKITMVGVGWRDVFGEDELYIAHNPCHNSLAELGAKINFMNGKMCFHNGPFDMAQLRTNSMNNWPWPRNTPHDTMINAHLSGEDVKNLKHLTSMHTDLPGPHSGGGWEDEQYLAEDVRSTIQLDLSPAINRASDTYAETLYNDLVAIMVDMRLNGVYIDREILLDILKEENVNLVRAEKALHDLSPEAAILNWNSPAQVVEFFLKYGMPLTEKTASGAYSVSEPVLLELKVKLEASPNRWKKQLELIDIVLEFRAKTKLVGSFLQSYLDMMDEDGFVYPNLKLTGTATGRLSCANPNLQQIPRLGRFKTAFVPPTFRTDAPGFYGLVDFAGAELRAAAIISGDKQMAEFILSGDPHSHMSKFAFPHIIPADATIADIKENYAKQRKASKSTTFAALYGGGVEGIARSNSLPRENVQAVMDALKRECPDLMGWLERTKKESVETLITGSIFGNIRQLDKKMIFEGKGGVARAGINTPVQSLAGVLALIVLRELYGLCRKYNTKSRPMFGVHDSIISYIAEDEVELYAELTQEAYRAIHRSPIADYEVYHILGINGDLEVGRSWAAVEDTCPFGEKLFSFPCRSLG